MQLASNCIGSSTAVSQFDLTSADELAALETLCSEASGTHFDGQNACMQFAAASDASANNDLFNEAGVYSNEAQNGTAEQSLGGTVAGMLV